MLGISPKLAETLRLEEPVQEEDRQKDNGQEEPRVTKCVLTKDGLSFVSWISLVIVCFHLVLSISVHFIDFPLS